ncbi:hypothetical protein MTP04_16050 [Lysinibacillus sp. PLM2]|nr:hypothetical protein MTP04_16050 [Lysinibacillus sp. PLM2]
MKSPLYAPNSIKLGLFSYKSGSLFNCDGGSVLAYQIQGKEFEVFLAKLFDEMGYYSEVTPHNDFGIDVIIIKDKIKTGIQAKCYGEGRTIGVEAVNEVCGGAGVWNVQKKMVITNRYFTKNAFITAKSNNIELIDRDGLQLLIQKYKEIKEEKSIFSFFSFLSRWKHG